MYTYYLDKDNMQINREYGNSLEEVYPGIVSVIEVIPNDNGCEAILIKKRGNAGWVPFQYVSVDANDLEEILGALSP